MNFRILILVFLVSWLNHPSVSWSMDRSKEWEKEPTVQEVQRIALQTLGSDPVELASLKKKARWSAALPRLQFGYARDLKEVVSLSSRDSVQVTGGNVFIGPDENNLSRDFNNGTSVDVRAVWYLNELIFNNDILSVGSEQRNWHRERTRLTSQVADIYFTRRRLQMDKKEGSRAVKLKIDQLTAELDGLTEGWFSQQLERHSL
ncbi:MAG: hypothetical protein Q7S98_01500 [Deltaproteobacteria bacterium]|nr:hypothetical protein [Deltaproteobacteria bacterium]